jgi:2-methylaconitate cis-trans-isomerase PrpF
MGLGDVSRAVVPKPVLVAPPRNGGSITSRYFTPLTCHRSHVATGALAVATAAVLPGSVANRCVEPHGLARGTVAVEHPAGRIEVDLEIAGDAARPEVRRASLVRTARRIFEGNVLVPESLFTP